MDEEDTYPIMRNDNPRRQTYFAGSRSARASLYYSRYGEYPPLNGVEARNLSPKWLSVKPLNTRKGHWTDVFK